MKAWNRNIEKYSDPNETILDSKLGCTNIEKELEKATTEVNNSKIKLYTHEEMKKLTRKVLD